MAAVELHVNAAYYTRHPAMKSFYEKSQSVMDRKLFSSWLFVIIMSRTSLRVNLLSIVYLNFKELLVRSRRHIWSLSDSNGIWIHNHFGRKRTLNHLLVVGSNPVAVTIFVQYREVNQN